MEPSDSLRGTTRVHCVSCGQTHYLTPSAMALVLEASQEGDLHMVVNGPAGLVVEPLCILTPLSTVDKTHRRKWRGVIRWLAEAGV